MTWVVGAASFRGHVFLVGDVQMTVGPTDLVVDGIQKVHRVGLNVIAGFAGSARLGFALIERLKKEMGPIRSRAKAWDLDVVGATWLPRVLSHELRDQAPTEEEHRIGVQLLVGAVDAGLPQEPHLPPEIARTMAATRLYKLQSPEFRPEPVPRGQALMIGGGASAYGAAIRDLLAEALTKIPAQRAREAFPLMLAAAMQRFVTSQPVPRVRACLHSGIARWGDASVGLIVARARGEMPFVPLIAETYEEVQAICRGLGLAAERATATRR